MDVELNEDEEEIRQKLLNAQAAYQKAFALIVAERLLTSLEEYLPKYWLVSAEDAVKAAWPCIENPSSDISKFAHCCKKLRAEEIGLQTNPVVNHVIKSLDVCVGLNEGVLQLDDLIAELHHLVKVVEATAKHPQEVVKGISAEKDYVYSVAEAVTTADQSTNPSRDQLTADLNPPTTTLFGTPDIV